MPPYEFLAVTRSDAVKISYTPYEHLPRVSLRNKRIVFEEGILEDGTDYSIQMMNPNDFKQVHELYEEEYATGNPNLLRRTRKEVRETMDFHPEEFRGGLVVGMVLGGDRLAAVGMVDLIDDEKDQGRGSPYTGHPMMEQNYLKGVTTHPDMRKAKTGYDFAKMIFPWRIALAVCFKDRNVTVTKLLGEGQQKAYENYGFKHVQDDEIDIVDIKGQPTKGILKTYIQNKEDSLEWLRINKPIAYQRVTRTNDNHLPTAAAVKTLAL